MSINYTTLQQQELIQAFLNELSEKILEINSHWENIKAIMIQLPQTQSNHYPKSAGSVAAMRNLLHNLHGSAAVLGFSAVSAAARHLEDLLRKTDWGDIPAFIVEFETWLVNLNIAAQTEKPSPITLTSQMTAPSESMRTLRSTKMIYLVEDDPIQARELTIQLSYYGYGIKTFTKLSELKPAIYEEIPTAIIMDIVFPEGDTAGIDVIVDIFGYHAGARPVNVPVIFITTLDDVIKRLQAVRAGGSGYFTKPVDTYMLVEMLDHMTVHELSEPYRILIVEDSSIQSKYYSDVLSKSGMLTEVIENGLDILHSLNTFNPDLILLDMYLPQYTGIEIARLIRQIPTYISIPIIFLSAEENIEIQFQALSFGVDDFLHKPPSVERLIKTVSSRVERYRAIRRLMVHDSLTGLLNHTAFRDRFNQEITRARRQKSHLTLAMLDIDHFKNVNDSYGHSTGDRVLKSLAQFLKQRLRASDIIGRYGGEEFAILLPDTAAESALSVLEELRQGFAKIEHRLPMRDDCIHISFSCGLAEYPKYSDATILSEAADQALYRAKQEGRNKTIWVDSPPKVTE
jgi:diguanylate cyclase (GGDEF)-like protein